jgi:hypothetical protein
MELESMRRGRRILSAAVALSAIALVMARMARSGGSDGGVGMIASVGFCFSIGLLVVVWRKEHVMNEAAFAARQRQQLASLRLAAELARKKADAAGAGEPPT